MSADDETIKCLLCRGVVTFEKEKDEERYKDHLKVEHRVYFYMAWIIEKTILENKEDPVQETSELRKLLSVKPSNQLQTNHQAHEDNVQEVELPNNSEDHIVIDNDVEEEIDDDEDDDLAWEALNNVQAQIGDVSDDCIQITDEHGLENRPQEVPFSPQEIRARVAQMAQMAQVAKLKMMSFNNGPPGVNQIAENLAKIKATLSQNGVQMANNTYNGDDSIIAENDEDGDYSNQSNHFLNQSNGFGDDGLDPAPDMSGGAEAKKAFLLVYPGEDGKSISYRCSICTSHKSFDSKSRAEQHLKTHIPLHERKRFQCPQCKERFITAKNLERHIKLAMCQGIKIYSCTVCKQQFDNKFDLGDHKKSTHQQFRIKHNCETCGEGFRTREALKRHVRRHTGEKPFTCEICQKSFKTSSYVKTHKKTQHNIDYVSDSPMKLTYAPENGGMEGVKIPMNGLNEDEHQETEEDSDEIGHNDQLGENGEFAENGVEEGSPLEIADNGDSEDTEDTNGDTEDTEGTNGDTDYEAMNGHDGMSQDTNNGHSDYHAMNGIAQEGSDEVDEPMENDDEPQVFRHGDNDYEQQAFANGRDNSFNKENGHQGLILG